MISALLTARCFQWETDDSPKRQLRGLSLRVTQLRVHPSSGTDHRGYLSSVQKRVITGLARWLLSSKRPAYLLG